MISVIIPVYKKTEEFLLNLQHNLPFLKGAQIIVVNDDPSESIASKVEGLKVTLIENTENKGFSGAINTGVERAKHDVLFLLNSDVKLLDDKYKEVASQFKDDSMLFAVAFAQKEKNGSIVGKNKVFWHRGLISHAKADDLIAGETGWAEGGSSLVSKHMFLDLGGFNTLYAPFYWEDIDLSYRAKKKKYKVLFEPSVLVEHHHESTIGSFWSKHAVRVISYRNQILCSWKHIEDTNMLSHILNLTLLFIRSIIKGDFAFIQGYGQAFVLLFKPEFWK